MMLDFEWDEEKDWINYLKHNLNFEEAKKIWMDQNSIESFDSEHSQFEERFIRMGLHPTRGILVVVFIETESSKIRIISARKSTKEERNYYERQL